jgi:hypothetical protein
MGVDPDGPSKKVTPPVGVNPGQVTVAVKVTSSPKVDGFTLDATSILEVWRFTTWSSAVVVVDAAQLLPLPL